MGKSKKVVELATKSMNSNFKKSTDPKYSSEKRKKYEQKTASQYAARKIFGLKNNI